MSIGGEDFVQNAETNIAIGDPTAKTDHDLLAENTDFVFNGLEEDHDFDVDFGAGYHNGYYNDDPFTMKATGTQQFVVMHLNYTGLDEPVVMVKFADTTPPTPNAQTDGEALVTQPAAPTDTSPI